MKFSQGHWTFWGPATVAREVVWKFFLTLKKESGILQPTKNVQRFKETGRLVLKSISALSPGILKQKKGKSTIHFNGDSTNTEVLF